jgi:hypothetical protein
MYNILETSMRSKRAPLQNYFLNLRETIMASIPIPIKDITSGSGTLKVGFANAGAAAKVKTNKEKILRMIFTYSE